MSIYKITWFHAETHFFDKAGRKKFMKGKLEENRENSL